MKDSASACGVEVGGGQQRHLRKKIGVLYSPVHLKALGDGFKPLVKEFPGQIEILKRPFDAHEEQAQLVILVLIGVQDIGAMRIEEVGNGGHQAFPVGTINQQNGSVSWFQSRLRV